MKSEEKCDVISMVRPIAAQLARFSAEDRINLLCSLMVQEICTLPPEQRLGELQDIIDVLPDVFRVTEDTMRYELVANARAGL